MSLTDEYAKQFAWRDWDKALAACPIKLGQKVLDLGCGHGDLSFELSKRGAEVVGVDVSDELLAAARKRNLKNCTFVNQDLNSLKLELKSFDGIWCSFTAAYFTDLENTISKWVSLLKPNAWICLTEMDDLLGHEPMSGQFRSRINEFYEQAFAQGRYDFRSGHKISSVLGKAGFEVHEQFLADRELAFNGPADPAVLQAWSDRLNRMNGLKNYFGAEFEQYKSSFLNTIASNEHHSVCRVFSVVGTRP